MGTETVAKKKKTYYSGAGIITESGRIIRNYIEGKYFNRHTGITEEIPLGYTKYNKALSDELGALNTQFYGIILTFSITVRLIKGHKETSWGDIKNLYRLMTAQSKTIKYNKSVRMALRKYKVNIKQVYDAINSDIEKEKDRVVRNKALMIDLFSDYGMQDILTLIEKETNTDIFDSCVNFMEAARAESIIMSEEDEENFRRTTEDNYVKYLEEIAEKNNVSLYDTITERLTDKIKMRDATRQKIKEEQKQRKQDVMHTKRLQILTRDNIFLQNDMEILTDIVEGTKIGKKFSQISATQMSRRIYDTIGNIYYIGAIKATAVNYVGEKNKLCGTLVTAKLFKSAEQAKRYLEEVKQTLDDYHTEVLKLTLFKVQAKDIKVDFDVKKYLEATLAAPYSDEDRYLVKRVMDTTMGIESNIYRGEALVYVNSDFGKIVCVDKKNGGLIPGSAEFNVESMVIKPAYEEYNQCIKLMIGNRYKAFEPVKISFNSEHFKNRLQEMLNENNYICRVLTGEETHIKNSVKLSRNAFDTLRSRMGKEIYMLYDSLYYVAGISALQQYKVDIIYGKQKNRLHYTKSFATLDLFEHYEGAKSLCEQLNEVHNKFIWRVFRMPIVRECN